MFNPFNPQPLIAVAPDCQITIGNIGKSPFNTHPDLALMVARTIEAWTIVEASSLNVYLELLGGPYSENSIHYMRSNDEYWNNKALKQHLRERLNSRQLLVIETLMELKEELKLERDKLINWLWGSSNDLTDALLLANPKMQYGHPYEPRETLNLAHIFVYRAEEFQALIDTFEGLASLFSRCTVVLNERQVDEADELISDMKKNPYIAAQMIMMTRQFGYKEFD